MKVLFLADAGPGVGGGHLMRCLTLAEALGRRGAVCGMLEHPGAVAILDAFAPDGLERIGTAAAEPAQLPQAAADAARTWSAGVVVVDHYGLRAKDEDRIAGAHRAVIDDLADRLHSCALLVDPGLGRTAGDYRALVPPGAVLLTGPAHALIRPAFGRVRAQAMARRAEGGPVRRVLVALGLGDPGGVTGLVVQAILPLLGDAGLDVAMGEGAPSLAGLQALARTDPRVSVHVQSRDMARLMAEADLCIGAGGSSVWERAVVGLPSIGLVLADNQRAMAQALDRHGAMLALEAAGPDLGDRLGEAFGWLMDDPVRRWRLSDASAALCDGLGAERVADAVMALADLEA